MRRLSAVCFAAIVMMMCLLAGCKNTVVPPSPSAEDTTAPAVESPSGEEETLFTFADLSNLNFWFGSGAGGWRTVLTVHEDGTFEGTYSDSETSDEGQVYYWCDFSGTLTAPEKVNDYTYSVKLEQIDLEKEPGTEETRNGIRYIYSTPYGFDDAEELLFYLPGGPVQELPEEYIRWARGYGDSIDTELPFYGLYNVKGEQGFSSHKKITIDDELADLEAEEVSLKNRISAEENSQAEMTTIAAELYQMWDSKLNEIWGRLKAKMDTVAMDALTAEELEWITYKESEMQKAGAEVEGGTLQPMVEAGTGAKLTKARVYELAEYLREK